jgi:hypothetical protein
LSTCLRSVTDHRAHGRADRLARVSLHTPPGYVIDRFEDHGWAVLEDPQGRTFQVPRDWLPDSAREGDVVLVTRELAPDAHLLRFMVDATGRDERLSDATRRRDALPRGPKGDISF